VPSKASNRALFLDRDGVINVDHGYVHKQKNFEFIDGIFDVASKAAKKQLLVVIVTNQSGIGRGLYTEPQFLELSEWLNSKFKSVGVTIAATYFCPHYPSQSSSENTVPCECRKPRPGMLLQASRDLKIDLSASILIGDNATDMEAAFAAGVPDRIQIGNHRSKHATENYSTMFELLRSTSVLD
jgi:D-glycero-D-manno-heptose 1,7-bisphosphate phosphatase